MILKLMIYIGAKGNKLSPSKISRQYPTKLEPCTCTQCFVFKKSSKANKTVIFFVITKSMKLLET